jgi:pimeloyl-ACP methyl ester carboxylesterase
MSTPTIEVSDEVVEVCAGRVRLHFKRAGDGPAVLFFHALHGPEWEELLDRLAEDHTVFAPEHPGTSPGEPQSIREIHTFWELLLAYEEGIRLLGLGRPAAIGESFGGMVAADLAATFPGLFSKLVLLSPLGLWHDDAPIPLVEMVTASPEEQLGYLYHRLGTEDPEESLSLPDEEQTPEAIAQRTWNLGCTTKFAWPIADHGLARRLHRISVPTLVLWGRDDALVPVSYADAFGRGIANSSLEVLDDCGHVIQAEQPEQSWSLISKFLSTNEPAPDDVSA